MGVALLYFITQFFAAITGAVMLIQMGGWLAILAAILILSGDFITMGVFVLFLSYLGQQKKKEAKEEPNA